MFFTRSNLGFSLSAVRQGKGVGVAARLARSTGSVRSTNPCTDRQVIGLLTARARGTFYQDQETPNFGSDLLKSRAQRQTQRRAPFT